MAAPARTMSLSSPGSPGSPGPRLSARACRPARVGPYGEGPIHRRCIQAGGQETARSRGGAGTGLKSISALSWRILTNCGLRNPEGFWKMNMQANHIFVSALRRREIDTTLFFKKEKKLGFFENITDVPQDCSRILSSKQSKKTSFSLISIFRHARGFRYLRQCSRISQPGHPALFLSFLDAVVLIHGLDELLHGDDPAVVEIDVVKHVARLFVGDADLEPNQRLHKLLALEALGMVNVHGFEAFLQ